MLYIVGPALVIAVVGWVLGICISPVASARFAALFGRRIVWAVPLVTGAAVVAAFSLPRKSVNGPIGATCPDLGSPLGHVLAGLAVAACVAAVAVVAGVTIEAVKRAAQGETFIRLAVAIVVPYIALGAWVVPALCDYS